MGKALFISIIVHTLLFSLLYWSTEISALMIRSREKQQIGGAIRVSLLYKPTDTPMRKARKKTELPPPKIRTQKKPPPRPHIVKKRKRVKKKKAKKQVAKKEDFHSLFDKLRDETGLDRKKKPRDDNFPTNEKGEKKARGTGGWSDKTPSPAQQALQAACRKYHKVPQAERMRRLYPDARGYLNVRLIGVGHQLSIVSMNWIEHSKFPILDQACETAVKKAVQQETFASDIVAELSGKENTITCQF